MPEHMVDLRTVLEQAKNLNDEMQQINAGEKKSLNALAVFEKCRKDMETLPAWNKMRQASLRNESEQMEKQRAEQMEKQWTIWK